MRRWPAFVCMLGLGGLLSVVASAPALACGGLIGPNGGVQLQRTTTLVGYHNGIEHYVTAFTFTGGTGNFGSITPLPAVPTSIEKGGDWTLQRLEAETSPRPAFNDVEAATAAAPAPAQVLQQATIGALNITVLKGGGYAVGTWAKDNGFSLPPDAPALLDYYANRSQIFMAAKFNAEQAAALGQGTGAVTSIQLTIPVANPWVPLAILGLGKDATQLIDADIYLMTDQKPALLPAPVNTASGVAAASGLTLAASEQASPSLISDLRADQGGSWIPAGGMWLTYLRLDTAAADLHYDLAIDASGQGTPSLVAAGLAPATGTPQLPLAATAPDLSGDPWIWLVTGAGVIVLLATWGLTYRRTRPQLPGGSSRA
ncbi:MAG: DUF2330 domain-containing protein [Actinomycetota bacterium]